MNNSNESQAHKSDETFLKRFVFRLVEFLTRPWGALPVAALFTLAMIYNYVFPLNSLLYTRGMKAQDCGQMVWNLWFANEAITHGHNPFRTTLLYYPIGTNLGHHTLAAGYFPVTFIVKLVSGGDPLYPIYAFRIVILVSFTLILYFSYLLLRECNFSAMVSATAAVAYAFSDFYILHVLHINHLAGFFIPLTGLILVRFYQRPDSVNIVIAALIAAWAIYFTEFSAYIYMGVTLLAVQTFALAREREVLRSKLEAAGRRRIIVAAVIFVLIVNPFIVNLFRDQVIKPPLSEISFYSANIFGFLIPGQERDRVEYVGTPYTTPLYGHMFDSLDSHIKVGAGGFEIFVGFPLLVFGLWAAIASRRTWVRICLVASLIFFSLSLGPTLKVLGTDTKIPMPYTLLMHVPPFDSGRTPVRIFCMALFFFMIVGAEGFTLFESFLRRRVGYKWASVVMLLLFAWTVAEVYSPTNRRKPFEYPAELARVVSGPVLNLPPVQSDGYAAMLQTFHHQPIATGYLARNSEAQAVYFAELKEAFDKGGPPFCAYVTRLGFRNVVISSASVVAPYHPSILPLDLDRCAINKVNLRDTDLVSTGSRETKLSDTEQPESFSVLPTETRIEFGTERADQYLWYGWSGRERYSHWTDRGQAALIFSLDQRTAQTKLTLLIFGGPYLVPGRLDAQRVVIKLNDQQLADWALTSATPQLYSVEIPASALRDRNDLVFVLPDAATPRSFGEGNDFRLLGFNVQWIELASK